MRLLASTKKLDLIILKFAQNATEQVLNAVLLKQLVLNAEALVKLRLLQEHL